MQAYPRPLYLLLWVIFINAIARMFTVLSALYLHKLQFNVAHIGLLATFFGVGGFLGGYLGGSLTERVPARRLLFYALIGNGISAPMILLSNTMALLGAVFFMVGFFNSAFRPASILILLKFRYVYSVRKLLSLRRVALNLGFSLGAAFLGWMYTVGNSLAFIVIGVLLLLGSIVMLPKLFGSLPRAAAEKAQPSNKLETLASKENRVFILLCFLLIASLFILNQNQLTYPIFLKSHAGFSASDITLLFSVSGLTIVFFQIPVSHLFEKKSLATGCFWGVILLTVGISMAPVIHNFAMAIISCIFWTLGEIVLYPIILSFMLKVGRYSDGKKMGIYQSCFSLGGVLAPLLGTYLYHLSPSVLWAMCWLIGLVVTIVFYLLSLRAQTQEQCYAKTSRLL